MSSTIEHVQKLDQGKQGITGLLKKDGKVYVYKISQYMNHLPQHEYLILNGLRQLAHYCPHFCKEVELLKLPIHPNFKKHKQDPFEPHPKSLNLDVLLMEYIEDAVPLYSIIRQTNIPISHVMGLIKQTMMAIIVAQDKKHFVHYDLHALNILVQECYYDDVFVYVLDKENAITIPTYGFRPIVIDYGFSSSKDLEQQPAYISLAYTDAGYASPAFDPIADAKILLVSTAEDFKECRPQFKYTKKYRNIVKNLFKHLEINWKSGWDKRKESPIVDQIFKQIYSKKEDSRLFTKYPHICMDIFQSLVPVPYHSNIEGSIQDLKTAYKVFLKEFLKIEEEINNTFYSLYIFRNILDIASKLKPQYLQGNTEEVVIQFQREIFEVVNSVARFCRLRDIHYSLMLCSIYAFAEQLEYQLANRLQTYMNRKNKEYQQMEVTSLKHMYAVLDMNFKEKYVYNDRTRIHIMDVQREEHHVYPCSAEPTSFVDTLNSLPHYLIGNHIAQHFQTPTPNSSPTIKEEK